jgi:hypothetical protein
VRAVPSARGGPRSAASGGCASRPVVDATAMTAPSATEAVPDRGSTAVVTNSWHAVDEPSTRCAGSGLTVNSPPSDESDACGVCDARGPVRFDPQWPTAATNTTAAAKPMNSRSPVRLGAAACRASKSASRTEVPLPAQPRLRRYGRMQE